MKKYLRRSQEKFIHLKRQNLSAWESGCVLNSGRGQWNTHKASFQLMKHNTILSKIFMYLPNKKHICPKIFLFLSFFFFFTGVLCAQQLEILGLGIKPAPRQWPKLLQWPHQKFFFFFSAVQHRDQVPLTCIHFSPPLFCCNTHQIFNPMHYKRTPLRLFLTNVFIKIFNESIKVNHVIL